MISPQLVEVAMLELPETIAAIRFAFRERFPTHPVPDDADIMAALNQAFELRDDLR
jgi:hypothetical protein